MLFYTKVGLVAEKLPYFSISFYKKNGEIVNIDKCECTSVHSKGETMNIRLIPSGEIRKIKLINIRFFNGEKIYV